MSIIHKETQWTILKKTIPQEEVFTTTKSIDNGDDLVLLQIPHYASLQPDTDYVVQCIHVADNGLKSEPGSIDFTPVGSSIQPPVINFPVNNGTHAIGSNLVIQASPFISTPSGMPHTATDWRIGTVNNPESITKNESATNLTSYTVTSGFFQQNTKYYLFARYKSGETYSGWSTAVSFTTTSTSVSIQTPTITAPTNGSTVVSSNPIVITASTFNCSTPGTTHASTIWQISKDVNFGSFVVNETSSSNLTSYTVPPNTLTDANAVYYIKIRYRANTTDMSEYSTVVSVTATDTSTQPIAKPTIISPSNNQELTTTSFIISSNAYQANIPATATHTSSLWQVSPTADFETSTLAYQSDSAVNKTSIQVPSSNIQKGRTYYIRVKHKSGSYSSEWSNTVIAKTTPEAKVLPISLVSPAQGFTLNVSNPLNIVASGFSGVGGATWTSASFVIATDNTMQNVAWSDSKSAPPSSTATVPANTLAANTTYYIQVSYLAANADAPNNIAKTTPISITTIAGSETGVIQTPTVTSPTTNMEVDATQVVNFIGSAFSATGGLTFTNKHWQIATNSDFTSFVYNQEIPANGNPSLALPANTMQAGTNYWVRVKYWGSVTNGSPISSSFSSVVQFKTKAASYSIQKPSIHTPANNTAYNVGDNVNLIATLFNATPGVTFMQAVWSFGENSSFTGSTTSQQKSDSTYNTYSFNIGPTTTKSYVRLKFQGIVNNNINNYIDSEWSEPLHYVINTVSVVINKPSITSPTPNQVIDAFTAESGLSIFCSAFSCTPTGSDTHYTTTWQVAKDPGFTLMVYEIPNGVGGLLTSAFFIRQIFVDNPAQNNTYYVRCKHNSNGGKSSEFSSWVSVIVNTVSTETYPKLTIGNPQVGFIMGSNVEPISFTAFTPNSWAVDFDKDWTGVGIEFTISKTDGTTLGTYNTPSPTRGVISNKMEFRGTITHGTQLPTGQIKLKCRFYKNTTYGPYSDDRVITVPETGVNIATPTITSPYANSQMNPTLSTTFSFSAFSGAGITHKNTLLQIVDNTSWSNPVFNQTVGGAPVQVVVPAGTLAAGKTYYCRVQYSGTNNSSGAWVYSSWSNSTQGGGSGLVITTSAVSQTIDKPGPLDGYYSGNDFAPIGIHYQSGTPYSASAGLTHTATEYEYYTDAALTNKVANLSKTLTSATAPGGNLTKAEIDVNLKFPASGGAGNFTLMQDRTYWVRYRYISNTVMSPWSDVVSGTPYQGIVKVPTLRVGYYSKSGVLNLYSDQLVTISAAQVNRLTFAGSEYWSTYGIGFTKAEVEVTVQGDTTGWSWTNWIGALTGTDITRAWKAAQIDSNSAIVGDNNKIYNCRIRYIGTSVTGKTYTSAWSGTKQLKVTP